jgi:hypothetical protein
MQVSWISINMATPDGVHATLDKSVTSEAREPRSGGMFIATMLIIVPEPHRGEMLAQAFCIQ